MSSSVMFDRKWKIVLNIQEEISGLVKTTQTKELKELKVTFNVRNTLLGDPSLGTFQIYNINKETETLLTSKDCYIELYTGYYSDLEDSWNLLFSGEVTNSYPIQQGTDIAWNVWARNAYSLLTTFKPSIPSMYGNVNPYGVLNRLLDDTLGLSPKAVFINGCDSKLIEADAFDEFVINGTLKEELDDLILPYGLGWQIVGTQLIVFDATETDPTSSEPSIKVSSKTGLLSVPVVDYTGVKFTTLLNGALQPTKIIEVDPNTIRYNLGNEFYVTKFNKDKWSALGKFRIFEVTHRGDTRGNQWTTDVTGFYRRG